MIHQHTCYTVACDVCFESPEGYEYGAEHFDHANHALTDAAEGEWWATTADVLCTARDDEHLAKAREIRAALDPFDVPEFDSWAGGAWREAFADDEPRFAAAMPGQTEIAVNQP